VLDINIQLQSAAISIIRFGSVTNPWKYQTIFTVHCKLPTERYARIKNVKIGVLADNF